MGDERKSDLLTHPLSSAGADLVRETVDVAGIAHLDDRLDLSSGLRVDCVGGRADDLLVGVASATEGVVGDLGSLGVSDQHDLGVGTFGGVGIHGGCHSSCALARGAGIAGPAAGGLSTA